MGLSGLEGYNDCMNLVMNMKSFRFEIHSIPFPSSPSLELYASLSDNQEDICPKAKVEIIRFANEIVFSSSKISRIFILAFLD